MVIQEWHKLLWLKEKFEAFDKFKMFKVQVENEADPKLRCLRYGKEGEFTYNEFNEFCKKMRLEENYQW